MLFYYHFRVIIIINDNLVWWLWPHHRSLRRHTCNHSTEGLWGIPRAAHSLQSALPEPTSALPGPCRLVGPRPGRFLVPHHGRPMSRQGLGFPCAPRPTIRYSYRTNLVLFLRGREAPLSPRDRESHYESQDSIRLCLQLFDSPQWIVQKQTVIGR